jgi:hypothetical protein
MLVSGGKSVLTKRTGMPIAVNRTAMLRAVLAPPDMLFMASDGNSTFRWGRFARAGETSTLRGSNRGNKPVGGT